MEFAKKFMTEKAEKLNGKAAMLGMFALVGAYYFTGQIVPGIFWKQSLFWNKCLGLKSPFFFLRVTKDFVY